MRSFINKFQWTYTDTNYISVKVLLQIKVNEKSGYPDILQKVDRVMFVMVNKYYQKDVYTLFILLGETSEVRFL
jgi:hypothetical protein